MARQILGLANEDTRVVDHVNNNRLDNRRKNLRVCTHQQNIWNRGKQKRKTSTKYIGVVELKNGNFLSKIKQDGKTIHIGCYSKAKDAAMGYDEKAKELRGEYAYLNFPNN